MFRNNIVATLSSVASNLQLLTSAFLLEPTDWSPSYQPSRKILLENATAEQHRIFSTLIKSKEEAVPELYGSPKRMKSYEAVIESLGHLSQHTGGLKSGAIKQVILNPFI